MTWWETATGTYVNGASVLELTVAESTPGVWRVRVPGGTSLKGTYASEAEAKEAARKLCQGIDPSTITGGA